MEKKTILVVDDEKCVRDLVCIMLRNRGHRVVEAGDAAEAMMKITREKAPDCVVLDAMLPDRTGFELCEELKADPRYHGVPVAIVSGIAAGSVHAEEQVRRQTPADEFISKPFRLTDLVARIEKLMQPKVAA